MIIYKCSGREKRPRTEVELREALDVATGQIRPEATAGYFRERADGRGFKQAIPNVWELLVNDHE